MPKSPSEIWTHFEVVPKSEQAKNAHLQTDQYRCRYCREVRAKNASRFINHIARDCTEVPPAVAQEVRTRLYKQHRTTAPREAYGGRLTRTDPELRPTKSAIANIGRGHPRQRDC
ncbi:hypothetical protein IWQ60_001542 [Tieghemiomyces parasiticus]|uniref:BED-type domain-containing protein n=1 Tax=Tieghemiomyces parasiticus TaxID=78921 RepID=A0A9W8AKH8_9FUNG|nr:hypothetical protein IWQ60_001542 [Tieghemiomyces parasiticus]